MVESLTINLGERSYPISFAANLDQEIAGLVDSAESKGRGIAVLTDESIATWHSATLQTMFGGRPRLVLPPGEQTKSLVELGRVLEFLALAGIDRGGALFAVGGGVIGDLGGFAAATWLRGIDFYQVPTTLLAMVDSSVGGKTGINLSAGKNLAGAFHQPRGVFVATSLLSTLPAREFAAGMAEIIKYGLLDDAELFERLEISPLTVTSSDLPEVIRRCCLNKAKIVEADEKETAREGGRALLNLGHTFGHAIENAAGYGEYLHGEAVAIGLCAAARLSHKLGYLTLADIGRIERVLTSHHLPIRLRAKLDLAALKAAMMRDKKMRAGSIRFVVLKRLGEAATQDGISWEDVDASFRDVGAGR